MARVIYVNGRYEMREDAAVHVEDRGYLFADGVYDAFELRNGRIIDLDRHLARLFWSMSEISIGNAPSKKVFEHILRETVRQNRYRNGFIYLQVTRGVASRDFAFPSKDTPPSIICIVYNAVSGAMARLAAKGVNVVTYPDERWKRPDIKTILLLPSVLARQSARLNSLLFGEGALDEFQAFFLNKFQDGLSGNPGQDGLIPVPSDQFIVPGYDPGIAGSPFGDISVLIL